MFLPKKDSLDLVENISYFISKQIRQMRFDLEIQRTKKRIKKLFLPKQGFTLDSFYNYLEWKISIPNTSIEKFVFRKMNLEKESAFGVVKGELMTNYFTHAALQHLKVYPYPQF